MAVQILIVDDEPDMEALMRQMFRREIKDRQLAFAFAGDGVAALEQLAAMPAIDLVVSDINMPRMDGLTLLEEITRLGRGVTTLVVSAYGDLQNIRTAMNRGAFDFITKPIDFADLQATIAKSLRHIEALRENQRRQAEAEQAHAALARYFSPNLAARLADDGAAASLASQRRDIVTVFSDVAGFTTLVEALEPDILAPLLNNYLTALTDIVFEHGGTVAKIVGDALHIIFGAPESHADDAARAVRCMLAMDRFAEDYRESWRVKGVSLGVTRIGGHAGSAIVGNFGGGRFFDYTAYGDTVNTAARLETANKGLGTRLCVSGALAAGVPGFVGRPIGDLMLRGRAEPISAFEPLSEPDTEALALYTAAFAKLEEGAPDAMAAFAALVGRDGKDPLAQFHLKRLLNGEKGIRISLD